MKRLTMVDPILRKKWQLSWDSQYDNKLHSIKPILGPTKHASRKSRKEETVMARLRLGHSRLTHSFLITRSPRPRCKFCRAELTIKHLMIRCRSITHIRRKYFSQNTMFDIFKYNQPLAILNFNITRKYDNSKFDAYLDFNAYLHLFYL